ncbi:hypothetical protein ACTA71_008889 [Dictyostelium dimigraforme]
MKFLFGLILLLSFLALVKSGSYNHFQVSILDGACRSNASLDECVKECPNRTGYYRIAKIGNDFTVNEYESEDCSEKLVSSNNFTCFDNYAPVTVIPKGIFSLTCTSASSQLTAALLFVVGLAFTMALF